MEDISSEQSVRIGAPIAEVWKAVTTPDLIKQWFFGVDTRSTWEVGSPLVHSGEWQGEPYEDRGTIVRIEPPTLLVHTHWSPLSGLPDRPEHYEEITWSLEEREGSTELTIAEHNLPSEEAKERSRQAWAMALQGLKDLVERPG